MKNRYALLRFLLIFVAFVNLIAVPTIFIPWESTAVVLKYLGVQDVTEHLEPIIEYWLVVMIAFSIVIGYLFLVAGINPAKYKVIIPILGYGWIFIGLIIGLHGFRLQIPAYPFYVDFGLCIIPGLLIVWLAKRT